MSRRRPAVVEPAAGATEHVRELRQANENLVLATLAAEEREDAAARLAVHQQDEFLAMLAHELRNPLAPIRSAAAMLARFESTEPALARIREVIQRQVEHMARLLDDLLDASRVTSGKVSLQRRPIAVGEFVAQAVETFRPLVDMQHQHLTLDLPEPSPTVDGDPVRLAQIVGNLLHNAAKYTPHGGTITIGACRDADAVVIRVADNGIGIRPASLQHVFDLFTQGDVALNRSQGGLGIGLAVVREMVALHGGTVEARSGGLGRGSEFIVTLPCIEPAGLGADATKLHSASAPVCVGVLLIDDNVDAVDSLEMLLSAAGHRVATAFDGPSALELVGRVRPEVVICDIGLPGMDGYEVAARLLELEPQPRPLMVAVTGYGGPDVHARVLASGFDHHLVKPADTEELLGLIASARDRVRVE
ncbi:MAG: hybrid sensor histidine kinase/response regulator [Caldimonas sp.]